MLVAAIVSSVLWLHVVKTSRLLSRVHMHYGQAWDSNHADDIFIAGGLHHRMKLRVYDIKKLAIVGVLHEFAIHQRLHKQL